MVALEIAYHSKMVIIVPQMGEEGVVDGTVVGVDVVVVAMDVPFSGNSPLLVVPVVVVVVVEEIVIL